MKFVEGGTEKCGLLNCVRMVEQHVAQWYIEEEKVEMGGRERKCISRIVSVSWEESWIGTSLMLGPRRGRWSKIRNGRTKTVSSAKKVAGGVS